MEPASIRCLAEKILEECSLIEKACQAKGTVLPTASAAGTSNATLETSDAQPELITSREKALGLLVQLTSLLHGPHDFLHEFVASNWDHGALYVFLQSKTLDHIASSPEQRSSVSRLSQHSGIPEDKLTRILALLRCRGIVDEPESGIFSLTPVSEDLIHHRDFRAWVEFQLFETRIASAHLADALLARPNDYANGTSGFKQGWGIEMYDWHAAHPDKGDRFRQAMRGVSTSLDPADSLIRGWIRRNSPSKRAKIIEIGGRYGFASVSLVAENPALSFEVRCESEDFLHRGEMLVDAKCKPRITFSSVESLLNSPPEDDSDTTLVYVIRNVLWNWADDCAIRLLQTLLPTLKANPSISVLVTDGVSPQSGDFPPHVEIAYRRRDITTMAMHNVKQRSQAEWLSMFALVDPALKITTTFEASSHVCKGLWELKLEA